nr:MAG TPA: Protein of unknown function (DUF2829) [Caudoviricetes sp.]
MEKYIGTKTIEAEPMTRGNYHKYRGWTIPADEDSDDEGYLVKYSDGYISWLPKKQFEEAYKMSGEMNFGHALELLKRGEKVAREGWNGKGMFLFLATGKQFESDNLGDQLPEIVNDVICMKTAQNTICIGWLASQADMLSEDWQTID